MAKMREQAAAALRDMVAGAASAATATRAEGGGAAVLSDEVATALRQKIATRGHTVQKLPLKFIRLDENIRRRYDEDAINTLAASLSNDGLIQFPTLCLKESDGRFDLVCVNGHRRILAAKSLRWDAIECMVIAFESAQDQMYHVINANMREDVFYLDLAEAYSNAAKFGETEEQIASRVGVSHRTVGQYLRLAMMPPVCAQLAREYPKLFSAAWGVRLARKGELPESKILLPLMREMVAANRAWIPEIKPKNPERAAAREEVKNKAMRKIRELVEDSESESHLKWANNLVELLRDSGLMANGTAKAVQKSLAAVKQREPLRKLDGFVHSVQEAH